MVIKYICQTATALGVISYIFYPIKVMVDNNVGGIAILMTILMDDLFSTSLNNICSKPCSINSGRTLVKLFLSTEAAV